MTILIRHWCHETAFGFENQMCLAFESPESWCETCIPAHCNEMPITGFAFGNLLSLGVFTQGYAYPPNERMNRCYGSDRQPNQTDRALRPDSRVVGDFEHDRKCLLLDFYMRDSDKKAVGYKIELHYKSIQRLVVDMGGIDTEGDYVMYFCLKHPPKIFRGTQRVDNRTANARRVNEPQFVNYQRDLAFGNCPEEDICLSSCLKLCLSNEQHSDLCRQKLWEIVSRIRVRNNQCVNCCRLVDA